jgi:hypothetical protein
MCKVLVGSGPRLRKEHAQAVVPEDELQVPALHGRPSGLWLRQSRYGFGCYLLGGLHRHLRGYPASVGCRELHQPCPRVFLETTEDVVQSSSDFQFYAIILV